MTDERDYMPDFGEEEFAEEPERGEAPPARVAPRDRKPAPPKKKRSNG